MFRLLAASATDIGRRSNNEDSFLSRPEAGVFALSDGMGGPPAGEVASALFVASVAEAACLAPPASLNAARSLLQSAFRQAHLRIKDHVARYPDHEGMGCTADLLLFLEDRYLLGHLGDSRVYLFRRGELRQLTRDHSLVQQMVQQGLVSSDQVRHHPMRNVLIRVLGADLEPVFDLERGTVTQGDLFLLCSDGLTETLEDGAIREVLGTEGNLAEKAGMLVQAALAAGGADNVTVVLCAVEPEET